jgi:exopolysaccharide biosynthesis WecB/TagA/CpsF family protein
VKYPEFPTVDVAGIPTAAIDRTALANMLGNFCLAWRNAAESERPEPYLVFSSNGHAISLYHSDTEFADLMDAGSCIHADGQSVVLFSRWFNFVQIPERAATTDMIHDLPERFQQNLGHYLLGGKEEIVHEAARILSAQQDRMKVVGVRNGYFKPEDEDVICRQINASGADVLWVGMGKPIEQKFCIRNRKKLKVPVIITCGGCYNYITGHYPRAPLWMQNAGLEWVFRLMADPRKLFWRYALTNLHSVYCAWRYRKSCKG